MKIKIIFNNHDDDTELYCDFINLDPFGYLVTYESGKINGMFIMNEINIFTITNTKK